MSVAVEYLLNKASELEVVKHLGSCDSSFIPPLTDRIEINEYAKKIVCNAVRFEAWSGDELVGLVAAYFNDKNIAYITSVSVLQEWSRKGIAAVLLDICIKYATKSGMCQINLDVASDNTAAVKLYEKCGFVAKKTQTPFASMYLCLINGN